MKLPNLEPNEKDYLPATDRTPRSRYATQLGSFLASFW
jgi:hypothetical protein